VPLLILFEGSIWSVKMVERRAAREKATEEAAKDAPPADDGAAKPAD
jgi:Sec-independent protein secretion pathway component TatC